MDEAERFESVVRAFSRRRSVTTGRMFGSPGLKRDGKTFAMLVKGRLVVKLPRARVEELVVAGAASTSTRATGARRASGSRSTRRPTSIGLSWPRRLTASSVAKNSFQNGCSEADANALGVLLFLVDLELR